MSGINVGERLVYLRGKRTQREVAEAVGIPANLYCMYELNQRNPSDEKKIKIAKYYKRSVQSIFFNEKFTAGEKIL